MVKPDVIAAIATAPGRAAIGVVRLSGSGLEPLIQALLGRSVPARQAVLTDFLDSGGTPLDNGIVLFFPAPHSYTGEDVLELQCHGSPAVLALLLRRCQELGARLAEPGEFSRRAFLNGKLDLAQAESVADLIEAGSEAAARAALRSLKGEFSSEINILRQQIIELRMLVEACIDFPEEGESFVEHHGVRDRLERLREQVGRVLRSTSTGAVLRDGIRVVLIGQPNVGKSSLLNRLAGDDLAIVTEVPGTTRDALRCDLILEGVPVQMVDTAGLREAEDVIEKIGIERAWDAAHSADLVVLVVDAQLGRTEEDERILAQLPQGLKQLVVVNKIDLVGIQPNRARKETGHEVWVSAKSGSGMKLLEEAILETAGWIPLQEGVFLARRRHVSAVSRAADLLDSAEERVDQLDLLAEELRRAHTALSEITGEFTADDLLGEIFSRFCIGK